MEEQLNCTVDHFGIAVPDIEEAKTQYEFLGYHALSEICDVKSQGVKAVMMQNGTQKIELLAPLVKGEPSPVDSYIEKKPYKIYHIALRVSDFEVSMEQLKKQRYIPVSEPSESEMQAGKHTVFMFHRKLGIIELVEE